MAQLSPEAQARVAQEDEALLDAEAQLPGGEDEIHWSEPESDSSEDEDYFPAAAPASHDHEGGPESQLQSQPLLLQSLSPRCLSCLSSPHFYSSS
jgi:hypothetical protein